MRRDYRILYYPISYYSDAVAAFTVHDLSESANIKESCAVDGRSVIVLREDCGQDSLIKKALRYPTCPHSGMVVRLWDKFSTFLPSPCATLVSNAEPTVSSQTKWVPRLRLLTVDYRLLRLTCNSYRWKHRSGHRCSLIACPGPTTKKVQLCVSLVQL